MHDLATRNYFSDQSILRDPYSFFEAVRRRGPIYYDEANGYLLITGFDEAVEALLNQHELSSVVASTGLAELPELDKSSNDVSEQIQNLRRSNPAAELFVNYDGDKHSAVRSLLDRLFVPSRLKANREYMQGLADRMIDAAIAKGACEVIGEIAAPYVTLVIADLLGVPEDDREKFREAIDQGPPAGNMDDQDARQPGAALIFMGGFFMNYMQDRRANPREDILTELATATYADGTTPDIIEVVKAAVFLFAAGQDTSAKLLGNSLRYLAENQELQSRLRANPEHVSDFIEEMLRLEGSIKSTFRLARKTTQIAGVEIKAGTPIVIAVAAANRDPRTWENPAEFRLGRKGIKQHLAFGRGKHTCIGAALARAEVQALLATFLAKTSAITLSEEHHGADCTANLNYEPSFIIRGLERLHLKLTPA